MSEPSDRAAPLISPESSTAAVAAWCIAHKLRASVVGRWVWVPYSQIHFYTTEARAELGKLMARELGWGTSKRRAAWYHDCGIPARKRVTGKLERYHRTISAGDFVGRRASYHWFSKGRTSAGAAEEVTS